MKTKGGPNALTAEAPRAQRCGSWQKAQETKCCCDMPPPVFLSKSAQAIENKRLECEKERQESLRVRKPLKTKSRRKGQSWRGSEGCGERFDQQGCATGMA